MTLRNLAARAVALIAVPVLLVALWWATTESSTDVFWPPLSTILGEFADTWFTGRLTSDVLPSLVRLLTGYVLAVALGVGLGVAIGSFRTLRGVLEPVLEFFRAIPPPVLVPVLMLFAGIGDGMKVLVIVSGCVWPVLLNTVEGVRGLDEVLRDTARCYRMRPATRLLRLVLPGASPQICAGARQALSIGIILMVISEMFAASNGVGFTIIQFQRTFAIPQMWTGIILLGLIGIVLSALFQLVEARALRWYTGLRKVQREG
ncbi:ABC-type nitrate/sulfonate/bicarbonate transport system permease component [Actinocorallia herbida]|uniref:ABC-type nitrate/sulfonate/bicarbonate transport system permease component n=1 Tax=Actinocorallia herbida TaxID=58109 RepID=A0A3N1CV90_9ACTN|nr:ABC transporter permease [Actinocorallia herbida]ROO85213.1 ABC-type nitrate/sulfonate/bicarbonate transport system permease component [Actinocorallia herbida]